MKKLLQYILAIVAVTGMLSFALFFFYMWDHLKEWKFFLIIISGIGYLLIGMVLFIGIADKHIAKGFLEDITNAFEEAVAHISKRSKKQ